MKPGDQPSEPPVKIFVGTDDGLPESTLSSEGTGAPTLEPPRTTVSVVVPVYYNAESIAPLMVKLAWFEEELAERKLKLELIFVDDGSGDHSYAELLKAKQARPATKIVKLARNFGVVAAARAGQAHVTGDCLTLLAADLQDPVEKVLEMVDAWRQGARFVICVRESREDPATSKLFAYLYYRLVKYIVLDTYPEQGFDLRLMDRTMIPYVNASGKNVNPNMYAYWLGFKPTILPYARAKRLHGTSRWTFKKKLNFMMDTLTGFSVAPIRMFSAFGFFVAFCSMLFGINMIIGALLGKIPIQGFATIVVLISFFSGTILAFLGILGEYVWRIFDAVNGKPDSVVEETLL